MKIFFSILIIFLSYTNLQSQDITITDTVKKDYPVGQMSWMEWQEKAGWNSYDAKEYEIPYNFIDLLKENIVGRKIEFILFGASWCSDSKKGLPELYKLFTLMSFDFKKVILIGVNREKLDPDNNSRIYNIEKVPTLIVLEGDKEIGRIVEVPLLSWYEDLLEILK
jgi:thiol-disulfide isomerase/thioredoxin